ncbi:uncharacterized protein LOC127710118 [Mytilus californianus]|uniref:uncharacterized protein LOC127710118 n=1 Tax=Mytilus californianus TaxID=6549 RepID=UPI00224838C6|nr:uncharacterized protein LOC127710118 [Mytilus californianus]
MAVHSIISSLQPILPQDIQGQIQASASSGTGTLDLDDDVKRWVVIGLCLHNVLTPALRIYVSPIITQMYTSLVSTDHINTQTSHSYLRIYLPTKTKLNYETINNNKTLYGGQTWKYDRCVKNPIDLSKLFVQTHMAQYIAFDSTCDSSALLAIIINIDQFPLAVQEEANEVRTSVRNCWAHCNFLQWTPTKFVASFQLLERFIKKMGVNATEENRILGDIHNWKTDGMNFMNISMLGAELVGEIQTATQALTECTQDDSIETDSNFHRLQKQLIKIETKFEEFKTNTGKWLNEIGTRLSDCSINTDMTEVKNNTHYPNRMCYDAHQLEVNTWQEHDRKFVKTAIINDLLKYLEKEHFAIVIGASGMGKSAIIHHIALQICQKEGWTVIPCHSPQEIISHYKEYEFLIFVTDDICGKYAASEVDIENWINNRNKLKMMLGKNNIKILASCRLEIFNEEKVQRSLMPFLSCSFDLSTKYKLSLKEKLAIAGKYLKTEYCEKLEDILGSDTFSPLLCFLFSKYEQFTVHEFLNEPFNIFSSEWDELKVVDPHKYCLLFMFVIFNGTINESLFNETNEDERKKLKNVFENFNIDRCTPLSLIRKKLNFCVGTYFIKIGKMYKVIHDKMFDFLCCYFGNKMTSFVIKYSNIEVLCERTQLQSFNTLHPCRTRNTVVVDSQYEMEYFQRFQKDIQHGLQKALNIVQMKYKVCREHYLYILKTISKKSSLKQIINKKDENSNNAFIIACSYGYDAIVQFFISDGAEINVKDTRLSPMTAACGSGNYSTVVLLLKHGAHLNQPDKCGEIPLYVACFGGFKNVIELLIEKGADINKTVKSGASPLFAACNSGDESTVTMLVLHGANVNKSTKSGNTPLFAACCGGFESIVRTLVNKRALVNKTFENEGSPLFASCQRGFKKIVQLLLENGAQVNNSENNYTPLHAACNIGDYEIAKLLIVKKSEINSPKGDGQTPLHAAVKSNNEKLVDLLVCEGADINASYGCGFTPLYEASIAGNLQVVLILVENGAVLNVASHSGETALFGACRKGHYEISKFLVERGADINKSNWNGDTPLHIVCAGRYEKIVQILIKSKVDIKLLNNNKESPFYMACTNGYYTIAKTLLTNKTDVNEGTIYGWSALYAAASSGHKEVVELLLENGANVNQCNTSGCTPLIAACSEGHIDTVILLVNSGADFNIANGNGETPMHVACFGGYSSTYKFLLHKGATINTSDAKGNYPLHNACKNGHTEIVMLILEEQVNLNCINSMRNTPLHFACFGGHSDIVEKLIEKHANVNKVEVNAETPLFVASKGGYHKIVQKLIDAGSFVNMLNFTGWTPLCAACKEGHYETVKLLLENGGDIDQANCDEQTPLHIATINDHKKISELLCDKGADICEWPEK